MVKRKQFHITFLSIFSDSGAIAFSLYLAYLYRFYSPWIPSTGHYPDFSIYAKTLFAVIPVYIYCLRAYGLYKQSRHIRRIEEIFLVIKAVSIAVLILLDLRFIYRGFTYSRIYLLLMWVISMFMVSVSRYFLIQWEYHRKFTRRELSRVLVVGANRNARQIINWAKNNQSTARWYVGPTIVTILFALFAISDIPRLSAS
ncbi:MAG: hypothetical protein IIB67_03220 [Proteobacteria bacterium]|nr:hypothetical protein [Pseudomonadota bacterium]